MVSIQVKTHLGESTVVPDVAVVGEAVADESEFALLDVLLDGVEGLLLGDLHLGVGPSGDLDDHVQDAIVEICEERDVVEGRDDVAVVLDVHAVLYARRGRVETSLRSAQKRKMDSFDSDAPSVCGAPTSLGV